MPSAIARQRVWEWLGKIGVVLTILTVAVGVVRYFVLPSPSVRAEFRYDRVQFPQFVGAIPPVLNIRATDQGLQFFANAKDFPPDSFPLLQLQGEWTGYVANTGAVELLNVRLHVKAILVRVKPEGRTAYFRDSVDVIDLGTMQPGERVAVTAWERWSDISRPLVVFTQNDQDNFDPSYIGPDRRIPWVTHSHGVTNANVVSYGSLLTYLRGREGLSLLLLLGIPAVIASFVGSIFGLVFGRRRSRPETPT